MKIVILEGLFSFFSYQSDKMQKHIYQEMFPSWLCLIVFLFSPCLIVLGVVCGFYFKLLASSSHQPYSVVACLHCHIRGVPTRGENVFGNVGMKMVFSWEGCLSLSQLSFLHFLSICLDPHLRLMSYLHPQWLLLSPLLPWPTVSHPSGNLSGRCMVASYPVSSSLTLEIAEGQAWYS